MRDGSATHDPALHRDATCLQLGHRHEEVAMCLFLLQGTDRQQPDRRLDRQRARGHHERFRDAAPIQEEPCALRFPPEQVLAIEPVLEHHAAGPPNGSVAADGRERIIRTAYELFVHHGLAAVGVHCIVAEAGVAETTLYRHFRSKDDLIAAVLQRHGDLWLGGWLEPEIM
jgi:hypothetical protein